MYPLLFPASFHHRRDPTVGLYFLGTGVTSPRHTVDLQLGFTQSFAYDSNSVSFNIGINLRQLYRSSQN